MFPGRRKLIPGDSLLQLRQRLNALPLKSSERTAQITVFAGLYGVSVTPIYRALIDLRRPHSPHRRELQYYCELIAALKLRTTNKKGRHLSTPRAIELLEEYGVDTEQGRIQAPKGVLTRSTVNEYLSRWHLDQRYLLREPPVVRFQAENSNACWQFDMSPSDLKHIEQPDWIDLHRGQPTLMLFSVVDDRSGACYQEYRCVYGEDAESALRFLFNAMTAKTDPSFLFQGRPAMLYLDNGPVAKSHLFQNVMQALDIQLATPPPRGQRWHPHHGTKQRQG